MSDQPEALQALINCLDTEVRLVGRFIDTLKSEAQILESGRPDELVASSQKKEQHAEQLGQATQARDQALEALGFSAGHAGLQAAAKAHPEASTLAARLTDLALQARSLNETNGASIGLLQRQNRQMLEVLQRLANVGTGASEVYDASGKSKHLDTPGGSTQPRLKPVKAG
ncbi:MULTISPECIES: flagella synthesis protein FlgN [unclassified Pusillimonas]|uniref:flagella synthesis protein FlgN n=1 Tax=unclassified Pusillimonas TaxID=2640016 RepID=UPI000B94656E|nr:MULTISPECIES: flagellar protein FlgN [unclassified Pusillimonas]OXR49706.1 flagellar protein FlgN [Pusillimonas sp. T2]ROT45108.1 flagellar protein FlgN [Pusillimonas sp. NJUB218]